MVMAGGGLLQQLRNSNLPRGPMREDAEGGRGGTKTVTRYCCYSTDRVLQTYRERSGVEGLKTGQKREIPTDKEGQVHAGKRSRNPLGLTTTGA